MRKIKIILVALLTLVTTITLVACAKDEDYDIVVTLYPQYDIANAIVGDKLSVKLLTPYGSDVHGYDPTPKDIIMVKQAKLFIYTSNELDPFVKNIITTETNDINLSLTFETTPFDNETLKNDKIHYWTDPLTLVTLVNVIKDEIIKVDVNNKAFYEANALDYKNQILTIHNDLVALFENTKKHEIYFYGHNALSNFANRYSFTIVGLTDSFTPDAELTPEQIINLKNKIKENNAKYFFVEELVDLTPANNLKAELVNEGYEVEMLELHGFHNITKDQAESGVTLVDLLKQNYENLKKTVN